jgi:AraC-like DNA-binding protein
MGRKTSVLDVDVSRQMAAGELPEFVSQQVSGARRYYFEIDPTRDTSLAMVVGGWERVQPDYQISRQDFPFYSIEFVAEGSGDVSLNGREHVLQPGSVFGFVPNVDLRIRTSSTHVMTKYYATFTGHEALRILEIAGLAPCGIKCIGVPQELRDILDLLQRYGLEQTRLSQALCTSLLPTLAHRIADQAQANPLAEPRSQTTYRQLRELFDEEYLTLKNVREAAERCHITVPYACRLFSRFDHVTPYQYLMRQKMNYAANLLSDSDVLVKQVAQRLDFDDQAQFSRAFKRALGVSPAQFQQQLARKFENSK